MTETRSDDITVECWERQHAGCSGYTEPESDPALCECECHDEMARAIAGGDEA